MGYLVEDLVLEDGEVDGLFVHEILLIQTNALAPVVEGAGNVNLVGRMFPGQRRGWVSRREDVGIGAVSCGGRACCALPRQPLDRSDAM